MENWNIRLKESRENCCLTLKQVTEKINITQQSIIEYEKGKIYPKIDMLKDLCDLYSVSVNYIIYGNEIGLSLSNCLQKELEVIISMYIFNKIKINNNKIYIVDHNLNKYINYFIKFIDNNDKYDINIIQKIINALNKIN